MSEIRVGIQVGSTAQYVGFKRDVRDGADGVVPSTEAPPLNNYDLVKDPDGTIWTVVRDSDEEVVALHHPLRADRCHYALLEVVEKWIRIGRAAGRLRCRVDACAGQFHERLIAADEVAANHLDGVQCRCVALPAPADSGPNIADLGTDVTDEYPLLRGSGGPPGEAPPLNTLDLVEGPDGTLWSVVRQSGDTVELNHPLGGCRYASPDAEDIQRLRARTYTVTAITIIENSDKSDPRQTKDAVNVIVDESGPGIAASPVNWKRQPTACSALGKPLPRPATRHQTTSWDPDMPLPDAEPGRYGWLP